MELFLGYEIEPDGSKVASPEKALFDTLYLAPARNRLFARRRTHIERRIDALERAS